MRLSRIVARLLKRSLKRLGLVVIRRATADEIVAGHPWLADRLGGLQSHQSARPERQSTPGAPTAGDPRLAELRRRYAGHPATSHSVWAPENVASELTLERFREDNAYVWQTRMSNPIQYLLSCFYVQANDPLGLFPWLREDGAFGAWTYEHDGRPVSRDLLDSILEISFLEEEIGLSGLQALTVLDIGAGYGRLAHRMAEAMPNLQRYLCTDAVPESTFVSEFYTKFRAVQSKVTVVPLDEIDDLLHETRVDVAVNIHSFSECSLASIEYWLDLVARAETSWLFIVPNTGDQLISWEPNQSRLSFAEAITSRGYEMVVKREKYHRSPDTQRFGLFRRPISCFGACGISRNYAMCRKGYARRLHFSRTGHRGARRAIFSRHGDPRPPSRALRFVSPATGALPDAPAWGSRLGRGDRAGNVCACDDAGDDRQ